MKQKTRMSLVAMAMAVGIALVLIPGGSAYTEREVDDGEGGTTIIAADAWWDGENPQGDHWGPYGGWGGLHWDKDGYDANLDTCNLQSGLPQATCHTSYNNSDTEPCHRTARANTYFLGAVVYDYRDRC